MLFLGSFMVNDNLEQRSEEIVAQAGHVINAVQRMGPREIYPQIREKNGLENLQAGVI